MPSPKLSFAAAWLVAVTCLASVRAAPPPHVLFVIVDDLRPQLGSYGARQMVTPNLDRLAAEGMRFDRAYCQVPVCGASRASLLTGLRPTRERFVDWFARADQDAPGVPDLPGWLRGRGYETYSLGKVYHHTADNKESWTGLGSPTITRDPSMDYHLPESFPPEGVPQKDGWGGGLSWEAADLPDSDYFQGQLTDAAIARLREIARGEKPTFLAVGYSKPHLPFVAPKKYWDLYRREELMPAANHFRPRGAPDEALHNFDELRHYRDIPESGPLPLDLAITLQHGYHASVSFTDALVGRLLDEVDRLGLREKMVVVLVGDHGFQLGEHALWCKHSNFETSLRVPLLVRAPGHPPGRSSSGLVEFVDLYPTLCELAGVPRPSHLQGRSFVPLLEQPDRPWKGAAFSRYRDGDSVRTDRFRYTEWTQNERTVARMLYDHLRDPEENDNIVDLPEYRDVAVQLAALLRRGPAPVSGRP